MRAWQLHASRGVGAENRAVAGQVHVQGQVLKNDAMMGIVASSVWQLILATIFQAGRQIEITKRQGMKRPPNTGTIDPKSLCNQGQ